MLKSSSNIFFQADEKNPIIFDRRDVLKGLGGTVGVGMLAPISAFAASAPSFPADSDFCRDTTTGLRALAQTNGEKFGGAIGSHNLRNDIPFRCATAREINLLIPEYELKCVVVQPEEGKFDFKGYDVLAQFARDNKMEMRGHVLVWYYGNPPWFLEAIKNKKTRDNMLHTHIKTLMNHTQDMITDWDVVNEAVDHESSRPDGLRECELLTEMGPDYIYNSFLMAHETNPKARLVYNDYYMEYADPRSAKRRKAILGLLENMKKKNIPIHALGMQSHLFCERPHGGKEFRDFLTEVKGMGIDVLVTELDTITQKLSGSDKEKAAAGANYARHYLESVQEIVKLDTVVTWGVSSKYSFVVNNYAGSAGPLPLNNSMERDALWQTIADSWASKPL